MLAAINNNEEVSRRHGDWWEIGHVVANNIFDRSSTAMQKNTQSASMPLTSTGGLLYCLPQRMGMLI
jgi:hypothetical protein